MIFLKRVDAGTLYAITGKRYKVVETPTYYEIIPIDPTDSQAETLLRSAMSKFLALDEDEANAVKDLVEGKRPIVSALDRG